VLLPDTALGRLAERVACGSAASVAGLVDEFAFGDPGHHLAQATANLLDLVTIVATPDGLE